MIPESLMIATATRLNRLFYHHAKEEQRPVFFDLEEHPALGMLTRNYAVIREEMEAILPRKDAMPRYHDIDVGSTKISAGNDGRDWKVFMLYAMGAKPEATRRQCPRTVALLDKVPNLFQAFFSILDPRKSIPPHRGGYLGYIRYHLGLRVPAVNPPSIRVKDRVHTWASGEAILFDDTWEHEVKNESDDIRVVLIVDVLRPLPPVPHTLNWLTCNLLIRNTYGRAALERLGRFH